MSLLDDLLKQAAAVSVAPKLTDIELLDQATAAYCEAVRVATLHNNILYVSESDRWGRITQEVYTIYTRNDPPGFQEWKAEKNRLDAITKQARTDMEVARKAINVESLPVGTVIRFVVSDSGFRGIIESETNSSYIVKPFGYSYPSDRARISKLNCGAGQYRGGRSVTPICSSSFPLPDIDNRENSKASNTVRRLRNISAENRSKVVRAKPDGDVAFEALAILKEKYAAELREIEQAIYSKNVGNSPAAHLSSSSSWFATVEEWEECREALAIMEGLTAV